MAGQRVAAVDLLRSLGITEPTEIDICAIAQSTGATVVEKPVTGCEARIIGYGERAIIVVNSESISSRKRFSAAHELGHWMRDAGTIGLGCTPEALIGSREANAETRANRYASDLLMPQFMFQPRAKERPITFETASALADTFQTSLTATSIRLVDYGSYPAMLICSDSQRVRWFCRGADVPGTLWPQGPGRTTFADELLKGTSRGRRTSGHVYADQWFSSVPTHSVHEDSCRISSELVLTLLWWDDESPLVEIQEEQERREYRRADWGDD